MLYLIFIRLIVIKINKCRPTLLWFPLSTRLSPLWQGGFILDMGVHFVAGLRMVMSHSHQKVTVNNDFGFFERILCCLSNHGI